MTNETLIAVKIAARDGGGVQALREWALEDRESRSFQISYVPEGHTPWRVVLTIHKGIVADSRSNNLGTAARRALQGAEAA